MNYVTTEQFLSLPEEAQKVFMDWWIPKVGDIIKCRYYDNILMAIIEVENKKSRMSLDECSDWYSKEELIPLFRLDQLWDFIEDMTRLNVSYQPVNGIYTPDKGIINASTIHLTDKTHNIPQISYKYLSPNKLQAFWKVAVSVAKEK